MTINGHHGLPIHYSHHGMVLSIFFALTQVNSLSLKSNYFQQISYMTRAGGNFLGEHPETAFSTICSRTSENHSETRNPVLGIPIVIMLYRIGEESIQKAILLCQSGSISNNHGPPSNVLSITGTYLCLVTTKHSLMNCRNTRHDTSHQNRCIPMPPIVRLAV